MAPTSLGMQPPLDGLSIGELARQTGVRPATLRAWETRFGFPAPVRLASGHRRYPTSIVESVRTVLRRQQQGTRLEVAIAALGSATADPDPSVFRAITRGRGAATAHPLSRRTLVALSHAIEDEICASASAPILFGAFQTARRFSQSRSRWRELARTATSTVVFADFADDQSGGDRSTEPLRATLPPSAPMRREWAVVCDSPDLAVCLSAWERPGQGASPDPTRVYAAAWTVAPRLVRRAALACASLTTATGSPDGGVLAAELGAATLAPKADPEGTSRLFERFVLYLDTASGGPS
ncbi:MAG: MerR family transcriptional regulator [Nocardioides sp.]|nr:MerR family transcriptional regulator [Nocardioides sp.]